MEKLLPGTWIASFADGVGECRLHFNEGADAVAAMLLRFDERGNNVGYFEVIFLGKVTYTNENEGRE